MSDDLTTMLFNRSADPVVIYAPVDGGSNFVFHDINPALERVEGVCREQLLGKRVTEVFPRVAEFGLLEVIERVYRTGVSERHPAQLYVDDRIVGWRDNHVVKLFEQDRVAVVYDDRTDLHGLLDSIFGFVGIFTLDGLLIDVNEAFLGTAGLNRRDVIGKPFEKAYWWSHSEAVRGQVRAALERAAAGETVREEFEALTGDVGTMFVDAVFGPLPNADGTLDRLFGFGVDVTTQNATTREYRKILSRFVEAQRIAHIGSWELDLAGGHLYWSDEVFRIFEIDRGKFAASYDAFLNLIHPEDREAVDKAYTASLEDKAPYAITHRLLMPDGRVKWVEERGESDFDADGTALISRGTVQDVTEFHEMEQRIMQSQRMEAVGQLAGGIAHDFNNLLGALLGNTELLAEKVGHVGGAERHLDRLLQIIDRASTLTNRLLSFSRQQTLSLSVTSPTEQLNNLEDLLRRTLGENVDLNLRFDPDLWPVMIDAGQLDHAIVNLAVNARDAMPEGGNLTIAASNVALDESSSSPYGDPAPGDYVMIAVSDDGTGIPPAIRDKVFDPFFTTKGVGEGSGLGLSMVYGFVQQSNGYVYISSDVGHGTTVRLYLPRSTEGEGEKPPARDLPEPSSGGVRTARILIVEDEPTVREVPVMILRDQGYEIVEAEDGPQALECIREGAPFHLMFTDIVLPGGMNGLELAEEAQRLQPGIKVLFATGYSEIGIPIAEQADSGVYILNKPYRRAQLLEKIEELLDSGDG